MVTINQLIRGQFDRGTGRIWPVASNRQESQQRTNLQNGFGFHYSLLFESIVVGYTVRKTEPEPLNWPSVCEDRAIRIAFSNPSLFVTETDESRTQSHQKVLCMLRNRGH